jgi:imidazole glycerol-phosphate synthase subunit HisH
MISVIDYGVANLGSIIKMLRKVELDAEIISSNDQVDNATKIILPGVGSFDQGMLALKERGLIEPLKKAVLKNKVPILGICLGMQLLSNGSEEGELSGLGLIEANCVKFSFPKDTSLKVPHMGWNLISPQQKNVMFHGFDKEPRFYFVHSYHMVCTKSEDIFATAHYGFDFTAMVKRDNIIGAQFHPEKSHRFGMNLFTNFGRI